MFLGTWRYDYFLILYLFKPSAYYIFRYLIIFLFNINHKRDFSLWFNHVWIRMLPMSLNLYKCDASLAETAKTPIALPSQWSKFCDLSYVIITIRLEILEIYTVLNGLDVMVFIKKNVSKMVAVCFYFESHVFVLCVLSVTCTHMSWPSLMEWRNKWTHIRRLESNFIDGNFYLDIIIAKPSF